MVLGVITILPASHNHIINDWHRVGHLYVDGVVAAEAQAMNWDRVAKQLSFVFYFATALVCVWLATYFAGAFEAHLHNVDLIFNIVKDDEILRSAIDWYDIGESISLSNMWILSLQFLRSMPLKFLSIGFLMGIAFSGMLFLYEEASSGVERRESRKVVAGKLCDSRKHQRK